ncbi:MAG: hypothetical protein BGO54_09220 [Sphingobacteriales bacterium 46-32]|nr:MAG: hypothetical protein BGO54_09220 [Sphingobacteriales bacterium 46-32]
MDIVNRLQLAATGKRWPTDIPNFITPGLYYRKPEPYLAASQAFFLMAGFKPIQITPSTRMSYYVFQKNVTVRISCNSILHFL